MVLRRLWRYASAFPFHPPSNTHLLLPFVGMQSTCSLGTIIYFSPLEEIYRRHLFIFSIVGIYFPLKVCLCLRCAVPMTHADFKGPKAPLLKVLARPRTHHAKEISETLGMLSGMRRGLDAAPGMSYKKACSQPVHVYVPGTDDPRQ